MGIAYSDAHSITKIVHCNKLATTNVLKISAMLP